MKSKFIITTFSVILLMGIVLSAQSSKQTKVKNVAKTKVTFIELGSVNCIPCKMMQPVMKNIEKKYGGQVKVIFYDVWTQEQRPYADKYGIQLIPTQIFLDEKGKEFHRHEGFYPEAEIDNVLRKRGLQQIKVKDSYD